MARTKFSNFEMKYSYLNLEWQLANIEAAIPKHEDDPAGLSYLEGQRQNILSRMEAMRND